MEKAIGTLTQQVARKGSNLDHVIEQSDADPEFLSAIGHVRAGIAADTQRATEMQQELSGIRGSRSTTDVGTIIHRLRDDARSDDPTVRQPARLQIAEALRSITDEMLVDVTEDIRSLCFGCRSWQSRRGASPVRGHRGGAVVRHPHQRHRRAPSGRRNGLGHVEAVVRRPTALLARHRHRRRGDRAAEPRVNPAVGLAAGCAVELARTVVARAFGHLSKTG